MNPKFQAFFEQLEPRFQKLISTDPVKVTSLPRRMPMAGVYVFYEEGKPLYVGRTNRMRQRIRDHSQESADDAPFAFRLAREATGYTKAAPIGRKDLAKTYYQNRSSEKHLQKQRLE